MLVKGRPSSGAHATPTDRQTTQTQAPDAANRRPKAGQPTQRHVTETCLVDVGDHTAARDGGLDEGVQLLVTTDGELLAVGLGGEVVG